MLLDMVIVFSGHDLPRMDTPFRHPKMCSIDIRDPARY